MDERDFEQEMNQPLRVLGRTASSHHYLTLFLVESLEGPVVSVIIIYGDMESSTWPEAMKNMKPLW